MKSRKPIILITGPKHSGKSLCARALGKITGWDVVDLDEFIEKQTGKSPRAFYREGPEFFRKAEASALASLIRASGAPVTAETESLAGTELPARQESGGLIVAAGGGLIDNPEALTMLSEVGLPPVMKCPQEAKAIPWRSELIIVFLDVSPETAWQRIRNTAKDGELPPFLNTENPKETHRALHARRSKAYKALAQLDIPAENKSPEDLARKIAADLGLPIFIGPIMDYFL
jgi:shikimate kinase